MTHHTVKANLEKGSSWPPEAMPKVTHYPKLLVLTPSRSPTPWTHPITPLGPGAPLRVIYYKLITVHSILGKEGVKEAKKLRACSINGPLESDKEYHIRYTELGYFQKGGSFFA